MKHSRILPSLALAAVTLVSTAQAEELFYAGLHAGQIMKGNPAQGDFEFLGVCGGPAQSMTRVGNDLFIGDTTGNIYRWSEGDSVQYAFTGAGSTEALVTFQGDLIVAGADGVARRYTTEGTLVSSHTLTTSVTSATVIGTTIYFGTPFGVLHTLDMSNGSTGFAGTCGGPISSVALDVEHGGQGEFVLTSTNGQIYRLDVATQQLVGSFPSPNDGLSLALHMGDLLVGGSDGSLYRIDGDDGAILDTLVAPNILDVQAVFLVEGLEPGVSYCYGLGCPCDNDDLEAGCVNGTGVGAHLRSSGSPGVVDDDLFFTVSDLPAGQFGRFYMGAGLNNSAFGNGILCAGSGGYGQFRFDLFNSGSAGYASLGLGIVDFSEQNFGALGQIFPGQTWHFQVWFRDPAGPCGASFNTSNGVAVTFQP